MTNWNRQRTKATFGCKRVGLKTLIMARRRGAAAADRKLRCPEARKRNQKLILILFGAHSRIASPSAPKRRNKNENEAGKSLFVIRSDRIIDLFSGRSRLIYSKWLFEIPETTPEIYLWRCRRLSFSFSLSKMKIRIHNRRITTMGFGIWNLRYEIPAMIQTGSKSMAGPAYFSHFGVSACC